MALSIKNAETERLARQLAAATGSTVTAAVTDAVRSQLREVAAVGDERDRRLRRLRALSADAAGRWPEQLRRIDHAALLYDDEGLPR